MLKPRVDGVGTCLRFLLERMHNNIVEGRIMTASNDFKSFENKVDKVCHRLDMLENKWLLIHKKMNCQRCNKLLDSNSRNKACDICIAYIGQRLVCERCGKLCTRTNRTRHYRALKCRMSVCIEL